MYVKHIVAAAIPRHIASWMSERMAKMHSSIGRSVSGSAIIPHDPFDDSRALTAEISALGRGFELGSSATAHYQAKSGQGSVTASDDPELQTDVIVVTKEVTLTVTQEERIERVIGF